MESDGTHTQVMREMDDATEQPVFQYPWKVIAVKGKWFRGLKEIKDHSFLQEWQGSLTPGSAMEQILQETISKHAKDKIGYTQHLFTKEKPYSNNMIAYYNEITSLAGEQKATDGVYPNFSTIFDTVLPNNLKDKLIK